MMGRVAVESLASRSHILVTHIFVFAHISDICRDLVEYCQNIGVKLARGKGVQSLHRGHSCWGHSS